MSFHPCSVQEPDIEGLLFGIVQVQHLLQDLHNHRASTIVLDGILRIAIAFEFAMVLLAVPSLEAPFSHPSVPQSLKNCRLYPGSNPAGQQLDPSVDAWGLDSRKTT